MPIPGSVDTLVRYRTGLEVGDIELVVVGAVLTQLLWRRLRDPHRLHGEEGAEGVKKDARMHGEA